MEKGDTYNTMQAGAVGPGAQATQFNQSMTNAWNGVQGHTSRQTGAGACHAA